MEGLELNKMAKCPYCSSEFYVDDGVIRSESIVNINIPNPAQIGYEYEMGRYKAQQDIYQQKVNESMRAAKARELTEKRKRNIKILKWVLFFPFMLLYHVLITKKIPVSALVIVGVALIVLYNLFCR
jgi:hypothetical protein